VFLLWDDVRALLVWQALVAALGAWAIYLLARDILIGPSPAVADPGDTLGLSVTGWPLVDALTGGALLTIPGG